MNIKKILDLCLSHESTVYEITFNFINKNRKPVVFNRLIDSNSVIVDENSFSFEQLTALGNDFCEFTKVVINFDDVISINIY